MYETGGLPTAGSLAVNPFKKDPYPDSRVPVVPGMTENVGDPCRGPFPAPGYGTLVALHNALVHHKQKIKEAATEIDTHQRELDYAKTALTHNQSHYLQLLANFREEEKRVAAVYTNTGAHGNEGGCGAGGKAGVTPHPEDDQLARIWFPANHK